MNSRELRNTLCSLKCNVSVNIEKIPPVSKGFDKKYIDHIYLQHILAFNMLKDF